MEVDKTQLDKYITSLINKKEDDFTRDILKPLFESMGYERVDFNGGPLERGRDLIAMRSIPPNIDFHVTYVQSKKIGNIQNTKTAAKLSQLIHQLRQCCTEKVRTINGEEVKADSVFLCCPEAISNRLLEEIGSQLDGINPKVSVLDGPRVIALIRKYKPDLLNQLSTIEDKLRTTCNSDLINSELLSALKTKKKPEISSFYSDLSFFVGSIDSHLLLHLGLSLDCDEIKINKEEWLAIEDDVNYFKYFFDIDILTETLDIIKKRYESLEYDYKSNENLVRIKKVEVIQRELEHAESASIRSVEKIKELIQTKINRLIRSNDKEKVVEYKKYAEDIVLCKIRKEYPDRDFILSEGDEELLREVDGISDLINEQVKLSELLEKIKDEIVPEPKYQAYINCEEIKNRIALYRNNYFGAVLKINNHSLGLSKLHRFLDETEKTLTFISKLTKSKSAISTHLRISHENNTPDRVSISPHDIFATSHDIAVYGGAGVGKTTTLQAYANLHTESKDKVIIYIPLNRLSEKIQKIFQYEKNRDFIKDDLILKIILLSKEMAPTQDQVRAAKDILPVNLCLILDGLDEIYNTIPEITSAIEDFKREFKKSQLIISSRDCVSYLQEINFLGITLLPFTKDQLERFIIGWLKDDEVSKKLLATVKKYDLYEHVKTPLLATIACSLAEKGVRPPSTESEIYYERLKLLTGEYDQYKNINRQTQKGDLLIKCARSIAYKMHTKRTRTLTKGHMLNDLYDSLGDHYDRALLKSCLEELINPCNVIIKDNVSDRYTFGHFRFQEHLVALELSQNRSISIYPLVVNDWWRGVLTLYSQENDFSDIIEDVFREYSSVKKALTTFEAMIEARPKSKRKNLKHLLKLYKESDDLEEILLLDHIDNDDFLYDGNGF